MKRPLLIAAAAVSALALSGASALSANNSVRVFVGFKGTSGAEARQLIQSVGGRVVYDYDLIPAIAADLSPKAAQELEKSPAVSYVELEQLRTPTGHILPGQLWTGTPEILPWGVDRIDADEVWDPDGNLTVNAGTPAGQGVKVAMLDSGLDTTPEHPDLAANLDLANSFDFLDNKADVSDVPGPVTGHGTATSGIVGAVDNTIGVIGVAPLADIVMYRVCDSSVMPQGECPLTAIVAALEEAVEDEVDVVSMSFGGIGFSQAEKQAIKAAHDAGLILVASAGNTPSPVAGARDYPSGFSEVIAVGATDEDDNLASFSSFGGHQELVAPGVNTPSTTLIAFGREVALEENSPTARELQANGMTYSATGSMTADLVNANLGTVADFGAITCTGKIALISRGSITFAAKVANAAADGCVAAIIYNNVAGNFFGTLVTPSLIPAVSISQAEGQSLVTELGSDPVNVTLDVLASDYDVFSGTSASAPHVSGVAALVLSADPTLSNDEVQRILDRTAENLGNPGRDNAFGWGLVDAEAAVACAQGDISC